MNLLLAAEELILVPWFNVLALLILVGCAVAWDTAIRRWRRGEEAIHYAVRQHVPWGADGAAIALLLLVIGLMMFVASLSGGEATTEQVLLESSSAEEVIHSPAVDLAIDTVTDPAREITLSNAIQYGALQALLLVLMVTWQRTQSCAKWSDFGLSSSAWQFVKDIGLGLALFVAALAPIYAVQSILVLVLQLPSSHELLEQLRNDPTGEKLMATALIAVGIAPLFEEFAFRVMLQGWFEKLAGTKKTWPIVASSLAFALAHQGQGFAPVPLFVFACFLGYAYQQTHRLMPCVVAHMAFNAFSLAAVFGSGIGQ